MKGRYGLMDFLLQKCSQCAQMLPNAKNERSETPLHLAAAHHTKGNYINRLQGIFLIRRNLFKYYLSILKSKN